MGRSQEDVFLCTGLDDFSHVHNGNVVRHLGNDSHVVRDHDNGNAVFFLNLKHKVQNLRLNGNVERCCRLVCDQYFRVANHAHRNHDALFHSA
ncbi:hypothetical protein SDC9_91260 [bioreactor metagenome]|uniref:Uncharacterized protein n=1 Tax=bioreactor metagenome TaxID=1076179 RepID=A0A644ZXB7_9ZZZZ